MAKPSAKRTGKAVQGKFTTKGRLLRKVPRVSKGPGARKPLPGLGRMSRVLYFGRCSKPTSIVVMLHGLNDSAESCAEGVAELWASGLPGAMVAVPQSPDRTFFSTAGDPGYDWLRQAGTQDTASVAANVRELQRVTLARARHVETWVKQLLKRHDLKPDRLILTGFSQGSILAALCAARLNALGAIACGGVTGQPIYSAKEDDYIGGGWMRWEELLPKTRKRTRFCAINGTRDPYVPRSALVEMLKDFKCEYHWDEGVGHDFPDRWYRWGLRWMKALICDESSTVGRYRE